MTHKDLMFVPEAARYLNRSEGALRMLIARGMIPYRRSGGRISLFRSEIDAWLDASPGLRLEDLGIESHADQKA